MKQNITRLIQDSSLSPVLPKVLEDIKNDYSVLLREFGAKTPKQIQINMC